MLSFDGFEIFLALFMILGVSVFPWCVDVALSHLELLDNCICGTCTGVGICSLYDIGFSDL